MIKKIIFALDSPFTKRDYERFGVEILKDNDFDISIWNFGTFINKESFKAHKKSNLSTFDNQISISKKSDFYDLNLDKEINPQTIFIMFFGIRHNTKWLYNIFNSKKAIYGIPNLGEVPSKKITILKRWLSVLKRYFSGYHKVFLPSFALVGGEIANEKLKNYSLGKFEIIDAHSFDYDLIFKSNQNNQDPIIKNDYAVFLDEYVPYHPDYIHMGVEPDCSPEKYYPELNSFFNFFEEKTQMKIIIAAHPSSNYKTDENPFNNRKIIKNETRRLIQHATHVVAHASTATSMAVIYKKPIHFVLSSKYSKRYKDLINLHASQLNQIPINISREQQNDSFSKVVDERIYKLFFKRYIKSKESTNLSLWEIFAKNCKNIKNRN